MCFSYDGSHHQAYHKNIERKYLQLHWQLEALNLTHILLCNI